MIYKTNSTLTRDEMIVIANREECRRKRIEKKLSDFEKMINFKMREQKEKNLYQGKPSPEQVLLSYIQRFIQSKR